MRRYLTLFVAILLVLPITVDSGSSHPRVLDSVRPLSMVASRDFTTNTELYRNICTVSSINTALHLWVTAAHCIQSTEPSDEGDGTMVTTERSGLSIDGHLVFVVKLDPVIDLAVLFTPDYTLPALHLAGRAPTWEDAIRVVGHPWGYPGVTIVPGVVSNPDAPITEPDFAPSYMFITALVAPGNSGSPVINARGEIVSVLQIGWGRAYSPGGGSTYARLKAFAGGYFERR